MSKWQRLEKGIVTGCTISVALFIMGMNMIISTAQKENQRPENNYRNSLSPYQRLYG